MSKRCAICGKGPSVGNRISHAHNVSKRRWLPNLQKITFAKDGKTQNAYVCTACIRSGKMKKVV